MTTTTPSTFWVNRETFGDLYARLLEFEPRGGFALRLWGTFMDLVILCSDVEGGIQGTPEALAEKFWTTPRTMRKRLGQLIEAGLIEKTENGYRVRDFDSLGFWE